MQNKYSIFVYLLFILLAWVRSSITSNFFLFQLMFSALQLSNMPLLREFYNFSFVFLIVGSYFIERCFEDFAQIYCVASGLEIKLSIMRFKSRNIEKSDDFK